MPSMVRARKVILTIEVNTLLTHAELKDLRGLVFGQLKGGTRKTIKKEKPIGTQHDCWGLIDQVVVDIVGPANDEVVIEEPNGHPQRDDWKKAKAKKRKAKAKKRAARDTAKEAKGPSPKVKKPRKPRPSELARKAAREAAKSQETKPEAVAG